MSFYQEIGNLLGLDWGRIAAGYSIVNYNGEAVYIEGIKRVLTVSETEIVVETAKVRVRVAGEELVVFSLEDKTMVAKGRIVYAGEVAE